MKYKPFMNKRLSKAIMQRTRFRNTFVKNPTDENRYIYTKQRNSYVPLLRKEKKNNTLQTLKKRISPATENFGILLNHCFVKKLNQGKVLY